MERYAIYDHLGDRVSDSEVSKTEIEAWADYLGKYFTTHKQRFIDRGYTCHEVTTEGNPMADKKAQIEQLRKEFGELKNELYVEEEFVANDENLHKWRRYNQLLGYFHPDYRNPYWVDPLGTKPTPSVKDLLFKTIYQFGATLKSQVGEREREKGEPHTFIKSLHETVDHIEVLYPDEQGRHRRCLPDRK